MKHIHEFAGSKVPGNISLFQLTDFKGLPSCHVYMEAQIFCPDSKRFILHRSAHPHGSEADDPEHAYFLCDIENGGKLMPLTTETGVCAPCVSPDGKYFYYFVRQLEWNGGRVIMKRVNIDGSDRVEIARIDENTPGFQPAFQMYPLSTISSDGQRVAVTTPVKKTDSEEFPQHALWIFDTVTGKVSVPLCGYDFCNLHMQYSRSPDAPHDIMIQHNHGSRSCQAMKNARVVNQVAALDIESGGRMRKVSASDNPADNGTGCGLDIHLIKDDGTDWWSFPFGRDGVEHCQGHQCWRGQSDWGISSTLLFKTPSTANQELIEAKALPSMNHDGKMMKCGTRNTLSRKISPPHFLHFATDLTGAKIVSDYESENNEWHLYAGKLGKPGKDAADLRFILNLGSREVSPWHPHPFLSPDGRMAFFNSSASGKLDAYAIVLND